MILDPKTGRPTGRLRPMAEGERRVCMGCHQSGYDDHPAMKPNPLVDPRPEPAEDDGEGRPDDEVGPAPAPPETRKKRRARLFDELNREAVRGR
ncbi:hypothetical protein [Paludisphaera soli]|uniref:hypothetical protein n=1 Tax=Paludisphaera soli TaxID=2712865 RepID=UPI0013ECBF31|nr:hypothetical protein [Paludisphaera soli]